MVVSSTHSPTFLLLTFFLTACGQDDSAVSRAWSAADAPATIPAPADWSDQGEIFKEGAPGEWDRYLWGGFTITAVKRRNIYYLYYQGSDDYDDVEHTVTHRAIGVATSRDGLNFSKHATNPVLTWQPTAVREEGAASGAAVVTGEGEIGIYYGANTAVTSSLVSADGRYAVSVDGFEFVDRGIILDHADPAVWGSGDELFPVLGMQAGDDFVVYYIPNGSPERGRVGIARGRTRVSLETTGPVLANGIFPAPRDESLRARYPKLFGAPVPAWGAASAARLSRGRFAVFVNNDADAHADAPHIDVYRASLKSPARFRGPIATYLLPDFQRGTVLLDAEKGTWFLYYRNDDASAYRVMTAPAGH